MASNALLEIENIERSFGGMRALGGVSARIDRDGAWGVVGPNGSGKTTLFNIVTGFLRPDAGTVRFGGSDVTGWYPDRIARRGLVRTFQNTLNPTRLTVMENLLVAPGNQLGESVLRGLFRPGAVSRQEGANIERAREVAALVKLDHHLDSRAGDLSGGQRKLLMLGQALMRSPTLVMLDEPVAGVHPNLINDIVDTIHRLRAQGQNFLIIEHNMSVVRRLCDFIYVLDAGQVLASGPTEETLQRDVVLDAYLGRTVTGEVER